MYVERINFELIVNLLKQVSLELHNWLQVAYCH